MAVEIAQMTNTPGGSQATAFPSPLFPGLRETFVSLLAERPGLVKKEIILKIAFTGGARGGRASKVSKRAKPLDPDEDDYYYDDPVDERNNPTNEAPAVPPGFLSPSVREYLDLDSWPGVVAARSDDSCLLYTSRFLSPSVREYLDLGKSIPGRPGTDYPVLGKVPYTNFYCDDQSYPGFFADVETRCQAWHYCDIDGRQATFLCPNGTQFSQAVFVCDWWFNVRCELSPKLYAINSRLYGTPTESPTRPHRLITKELLENIFMKRAGGRHAILVSKRREGERERGETQSPSSEGKYFPRDTGNRRKTLRDYRDATISRRVSRYVQKIILSFFKKFTNSDFHTFLRTRKQSQSLNYSVTSIERSQSVGFVPGPYHDCGTFKGNEETLERHLTIADREESTTARLSVTIVDSAKGRRESIAGGGPRCRR
ncbi:Uncharacterized protein DBV15_01496 [Temnothorax longispinosus]|uniref:Chitin-binding type-2 domain-containing protein n=1 Tax=Temnothorax longispinosus TaxID=300112 RepID=A0A4S2KTR9_9HYME|nr:Uncharacterized protein DBV15_01496 [Temnothorax longispinosus]